ncbi:SpoIIE family protein phosphatase [Terriglobus sp. 2YAB30_2]|uniref:SpoIIE family protein phosphatase n=1 Tax=unclassified Terriglobus TaxID=2628988 RepID=UPI003F98FBDB
MATAPYIIRPQLVERRARLQAASGSVPDDYLRELLAEVDTALAKIEVGRYGLCETCNDSIEKDRLELDPLCRFCLDHLDDKERAQHQKDLDLATQIQFQLLPPRNLTLERWEAQYRYEPVGAVGGDYCEVSLQGDAASGNQCLFFAVGDVAGKGVAASLLMMHLSAIFRSLLSMNLSLAELVTRANRLFCESTGPAHYATLVCGRATTDGIEICNAGHCPPLLLLHHGTECLDSNGLPLGISPSAQYTVTQHAPRVGECLVFYSDGITEATCPSGDDYQHERLIQTLRQRFPHGAQAMCDAVLHDLGQFRGATPAADDVTLLVVRRR